MKFNPLPLSGTYEITIEPHGDARGIFARIFCEKEFMAYGLNTGWAQMNISFSTYAGTMRGLHFQRPPHAEAKLVRALRGRAFDVILDLRRGSPSFGRHASVILDSAVRNAVYVPAGFAHGFQTLTDDCELQYFHSGTYQPEAEGGVQALDPSLAIGWPLPTTHRSPRDEALPTLREIVPL